MHVLIEVAALGRFRTALGVLLPQFPNVQLVRYRTDAHRKMFEEANVLAKELEKEGPTGPSPLVLRVCLWAFGPAGGSCVKTRVG